MLPLIAEGGMWRLIGKLFLQRDLEERLQDSGGEADSQHTTPPAELVAGPSKRPVRGCDDAARWAQESAARTVE